MSLLMNWIFSCVLVHVTLIKVRSKKRVVQINMGLIDGAIAMYYLGRDLGLELSLSYFSQLAGTQFTKQRVKLSSSNE